ncbi:hypothetical protein CYY_001408 [Polysphondylium violaceum]|uniref:Uncharacterized protein n=1 Tax=Polysphondylium violaceum TaxID=133409 RepID=A0A8J4PY91_9MYCE|nr:hypothetical protein CYY_001408 [Polysphondylium violaceum]
MNDQKSVCYAPKLSQELENGEHKTYTFESDHSKVFTFEGGKMSEKIENLTPLSINNNKILDGPDDKKSKQISKPLPNTPLKNQQQQQQLKPMDPSSETPFNTPNTQYSSLDLQLEDKSPAATKNDHSNVDFGRFKQGIHDNLTTKKQDDAPADKNKEIADDLHLQTLHKNPNVGAEQFFTSFQQYVPTSGETTSTTAGSEDLKNDQNLLPKEEQDKPMSKSQQKKNKKKNKNKK